MNVSDLKKHIASGAAFRTRITIQPMGGPGDKVFPPTYLDAEYATEKRWIRNDDDGNPQTTDCVQLDSVQSQANRCLLYTSPSPRDRQKSRMPSSA